MPLDRSLELTRRHTLACRTGRVRSIGTASTGEELLLFSVDSGKEHFFVEGARPVPVASAVRVHLASVYAVIEDALRDP